MPYSSWGDFICGAFVLIIIIFHFLNKSKKNYEIDEEIIYKMLKEYKISISFNF
mgnify:CR=1 FL=1